MNTVVSLAICTLTLLIASMRLAVRFYKNVFANLLSDMVCGGLHHR